MSAWRRLALELFPEDKRWKRWIQNPEFTFSIYPLFFDLLPLTHEAHRAQDKETLVRIYQYAEWCWMQNRAPNIQNAVAVAFYEHLIDSPESKRDIPSYLKPRIFEDVRPLFERRMSDEEYQDLLAQYNKANETCFV